MKLGKIRELFLSNKRESIAVGLVFLIADYNDLYKFIRNSYPNPVQFDNVIYKLLRGQLLINAIIIHFINTSIIFYINDYIDNNC